MELKLPGLGQSNDKNSKGQSDREHTTLIMSGLKNINNAEVRPLPLIGHLPIERQYLITMISGLTFLVISGLLLILNSVQSNNKTAYITRATEMQMLTQRLNIAALQSLTGNQHGYGSMKMSQNQFKSDLDTLINGGFGLPRSPASVQPELAALQKQWEPIDAQLNRIADNQDVLRATSLQLAGILQKIGDQITIGGELAGHLNNAGTPAQAALANQLVSLTVDIGKSTAMISRMVDQPEWRMGQTTPNDEKHILTQIRADVANVQSVIDQLRGSGIQNSEGSRMATYLASWNALHAAIPPALDQASQVLALKHDSLALLTGNNTLFQSTQDLTATYQKLGVLGSSLAILTGLMALGSLILFGVIILNESRRRVFLSEAENKRNQEAILRLLNELGDLADGDLTANATVTEDITGAIADSINFTIDELRALVLGINNATEKVTQTTMQAQSTSEELLAAARRQSEAIEETSAEILSISQSVNEVSTSASQSSLVATQSLDAAEKGTHAVENSIAGMNSIRENIQETSKRIKRLGESSQEIGEIVELISDITEQTNVLALNAAIQAATAGEAGRGFSVVAEEVQRLAERSAQATKQIAAIVKTIQSDTLDAVSAMEISTQGVVEGARLSDAAGQALHEIEDVTHNLAALIRSISAASVNQTVAASKVAQSMQYIRQITEQTMAGTQHTTAAIGELSGLSSDLKKSISGFKLN